MASEPTETANGYVGRIKAILLKPREAFTAIDAEPESVQGILLRWVVPLAAIGPLAGLIRMFAFGYNILGSYVAVSPGFVVASAVSAWVMSVLSALLLAVVINELATSFAGRKDFASAMKVAAYGSTAFYLSGIFDLIPGLQMLSIVGLYSFYLLYVALPVMMKSAPDRTLIYLLATIVCAIVLGLIAGYLNSMMTAMFVLPTVTSPGIP